jgi:hypothetical protein
MNRSSRWALVAAALALGGTALAVHLVSASGSGVRSGRLAVRRGAVAPTVPVVRGDALVLPGGAAQRLDAPASAPLVGTQAPVATRSPDGRSVAYETFSYARRIDREQSFSDQGIERGDVLGTPRIRLRDLDAKRETALEPGSQSPAWRSDGALAYVVGAPPEYRADEPFLTNVVVRSAPDADPAAWTQEPGRYTVLGWAGTTLLVQRATPGDAPDILAFDAPNQLRTLASHASLLAVTPDGERVVVADSPADSDTPSVQLIRVDDGSTIGAAFVADARDPLTNAPQTWMLGPGSWADDRVVAASSSGLVVIRVGETLDFEQVLHLDSATQPEGALFEPRFAGGARTIAAWSQLPGTDPPRFAQLVCDRTQLACTRGPAVPAAAIPHPVYDSSGGNR